MPACTSREPTRMSCSDFMQFLAACTAASALAPSCSACSAAWTSHCRRSSSAPATPSQPAILHRPGGHPDCTSPNAQQACRRHTRSVCRLSWIACSPGTGRPRPMPSHVSTSCVLLVLVPVAMHPCMEDASALRLRVHSL